MQRFQLGCAVQPYTGGSEHTSRSTESIDTSPVRSGTTTPIIQHDSMPVGSSEDRRFCCKAQCKNEEVLESTSGPGCISSGRVLPEMAEERHLLASTVENDPKGNSQVSTVEDHQRSVGDALLAHPMILRMKHLTPPLLMYTNNWTLTAWHLSTKAGHAMFLADNQHFSYQYLNGLRSSIAPVFKHIHPHQKPIASQQNISRFFTAKRKTEIRIPTVASKTVRTKLHIA
ncbi:hypothetical protein G6F57_015318 [Rhizopus arrhizus]|uniref:Uncharacterized protein n=1 Tax=Rhizopus oryzae TaxID=64495 RepID=A0A9P6WWI7_RHIOR|nr:hypothetical protein G6F23_012238 [Rhizopus arrhizus]KAG1392355.1 hypothetical protein G6F58_012531 [Rhizopus delemar]KAG0775741.1 hypothetical protein G6F22_013078 [Rhizopus arrhizus]KAG0779892.1 hypothetical protein G6F21_012384 [Rhizopus arrhizus]KAG0804407.1 hypothetical protein G6F20_012725 [Rhizopus arrhizus]